MLFSEEGEKFFTGATADLQIFIQPSMKDSNLQIYGHIQQVQTFIKRITEYLENPAYIREFINLRNKGIGRLLTNNQEAIKKIQNSYPKSSISLNLFKKEIEVKGPRDDVQSIKKEISKYLDDLKQSEKKLDENTCSICWDVPTNPYSLTSCAHRFCKGCLKSYLLDIIQNPDEFPIKCPECAKILYLQDIRSLLDPGSFDRLAMVSIKK